MSDVTTTAKTKKSESIGFGLLLTFLAASVAVGCTVGKFDTEAGFWATIATFAVLSALACMLSYLTEAVNNLADAIKQPKS